MKKILFALIFSALLQTNIYANSQQVDLFSKSNVSQKQLEYGLLHNLSQHSDVFVECEESYGINAIALSSIAALESGWGTSELAESKNNLFGWRTDSGEYMQFVSQEACIQNVAKYLHQNYLQENGKYYSGGTHISNISHYYSESNEWEQSVEEIAFQIEKRCDNYNVIVLNNIIKLLNKINQII